MFNDCDLLLRNVFKNLSNLFLSISMFDSLDRYIKIEHGLLRISYSTLVVAKGNMVFSLYILNGSTIMVHISLAIDDSRCKIKLWHLRLWYIS
jgi:hypothetical protein